MDIASVLADHGLDLATVMTPEGLGKLVEAYSTLTDTLTADNETQQQRVKAVRDDLVTTHADQANQVAMELRGIIAEQIRVKGESILPALVEAVQGMKQDLMVLRDFEVESVARNNKPAKVKNSDEIEARKVEAQTLREAIGSVWSLIGKPTEELPTRKNSKNEIVLDLPRIPGGSQTGNVGRGAKIRQMRFEVDGTIIPQDVKYYDLVRSTCDLAKGVIISTADISGALPDGQSFSPEGYANRWTVTVQGHTFSGWLPADE